MDKRIKDELIAETVSIKQKVNEMLVSLERILDKIEESVLNETITIDSNIYNDSIWNDLGIHFMKKGLPQLAITVYSRMLGTIRKYEKLNNKTLYKGLVFQNLGAAFYSNYRLDEAKQYFKWAYEEKVKLKGKEEAEKSLSKKALDEIANIS
jgi:hypothetical protein